MNPPHEVQRNSTPHGGAAASEYPGLIAAMARFDDEIPELEREGVHFVWNYYAEAGVGFADDVRAKLEAASRRAR